MYNVGDRVSVRNKLAVIIEIDGESITIRFENDGSTEVVTRNDIQFVVGYGRGARTDLKG